MLRPVTKQRVFVALLVVAGCILAMMFNFFVVEPLLIPDPCYYHSHDTNVVFDLFYSLPASEGFHPVPTLLNSAVTLSLGALGGFLYGLKRTAPQL